jgi:hypothetical protein
MNGMSITVELTPDVEARAATRAAALGLTLEAYLQRLLEEAVQAPASPVPSHEFERLLDALSAGQELPVLSSEATSPAGLYGDHD